MVNVSIVRYSRPMVATHTPIKSFAHGECEKAASGDRKVGGFAA
jgi:hypothetical protein